MSIVYAIFSFFIKNNTYESSVIFFCRAPKMSLRYY